MSEPQTIEAINSPFRQSSKAKEAHIFEALPGMTPTNIVVTLWDETTSTDVSSTKLTGLPTAYLHYITTPLVGFLEANHKYRCDITFSNGLETRHGYFRIYAE